MKKAFNILLLVLLLALLVAAVAVFVSPEARKAVLGKGALEQRAGDFEKQYGSMLLTYSDADYGYSVRYPKGYQLIEDAYSYTDSTAVVFSARIADYVEVIEVRAMPSFAQEDFDAIAASYNASEIKLKKTDFLNGRNVFLLNTEVDADLGKYYGRQAFFTGCKAPDGSEYALALTAAIPEPLVDDVALADYMIASLKC
jgi:hypothetical protein